MKANMPFKTQPIRNMKTGMEDTKKRTPRLVNVKSYNLDALVEFALDNNYIEGAKYELAKRIAEAQTELVWTGRSLTIADECLVGSGPQWKTGGRPNAPSRFCHQSTFGLRQWDYQPMLTIGHTLQERSVTMFAKPIWQPARSLDQFITPN